MGLSEAIEEEIKKVLPQIMSREALLLHGRGFTIKQIAEAENISIDTVRATIRKHGIKPVVWGESCKKWNLAYIKSVIDANWKQVGD